MISKLSRLTLNLGLAAALVFVALQAMRDDGRAEMIRPGEAHLEDLAPHGGDKAQAPQKTEAARETPPADAAAAVEVAAQDVVADAGPRATPNAPPPADAKNQADAAARDPDAGKPWDGPWLTRASAVAPVSRERKIAAARLSALSKKRYSIDALAKGAAKDPLHLDVRYWRNARFGKVKDWKKARDFLERRSEWPSLNRLRAATERLLPESLSADETIAFFGDRQPLSARGARLLGDALIAKGRVKDGQALIIDAWRTRPISSAEEKKFLKTHATLLKPHHAARFEALLWRKQLNAAKRLSRKLPKGFDKLTDAVTALYRRLKGVDGKIKAVPAALKNHPSLHHARMVWRERKRRRKEAEKALQDADAAGALGQAEAWAKLRMRFARDAYEDGRHAEAATISKGHQLEAGVRFAELEWFAGWMLLKRLNKPKEALDRFSSLWKGVKTPISRSRAAYWAGEAAEASGDAALALSWREKAAALPSAFYGQMAAQKLGREPQLTDAPTTRATFDIDDFTDGEQAAIAAADLLYAAGLQSEGRLFMKALAKRRADPASLGYLARRANANGDYFAEIIAAQRALELKAPIWRSLFPIPPSPRFAGRRVEPALLLAIARQESRFMRQARSGAGAIGLMQMMPATARITARKLKVPFQRDRLTSDWAYNLSLSDAHMAGVLERYNGSYVLSIAAYNAGEGNVDKWIKRFGDPRDPDVDTVTWIESIPFHETRNYVQRVLEAAQIYRIRIAASHDLRLNADLRRGEAPRVDGETTAKGRPR